MICYANNRGRIVRSSDSLIVSIIFRQCDYQAIGLSDHETTASEGGRHGQ